MAGGRKAKPAPPPRPTRTLVLDNGAYTIKAGFADGDEPFVIPNCIARDRQRRTYIGSELTARCRDFGEVVFRRPVEKGYVVNWEAERAIWAHEFGEAAEGHDAALRFDPGETRLVLTEQPNALPALQANCDQMVFEEFRFASYYRGTAAQFNAYLDLGSATSPATDGTGGADATTTDTNGTTASTATTTATGAAEIRLVIDAGYSFTTVTPVLHGRAVPRAVRRLDVGGKLLTNYLTKLLSVRHYDMRHDTYIVNEMKEKACYVSLDFAGDLDAAWKGPRAGADAAAAAVQRRRLDVYRGGSHGIAKAYVLPDYQTRMAGVVREFGGDAGGRGAGAATDAGEDVLVLRNERFAVPELLFHPGDVGVRQPGLADVVAQSVACLPVGLWPALLANVVVVGGCAALPGLAARLERDVQARMPDDLVVRVTVPTQPATATWRGAAQFASRPDNAAVVDRVCVTRQEYDEHGAGWVARKLATGLGDID